MSIAAGLRWAPITAVCPLPGALDQPRQVLPRITNGEDLREGHNKQGQLRHGSLATTDRYIRHLTLATSSTSCAAGPGERRRIAPSARRGRHPGSEEVWFRAPRAGQSMCWAIRCPALLGSGPPCRTNLIATRRDPKAPRC